MNDEAMHQSQRPPVSIHCRQRVLWRLLCPAILPLALLGCRGPWHVASHSEPSFDQLLEIEQAQESHARPDLMSQLKRPGPRKVETSKASAASRHQQDSETAELESATAAERELLNRTQQALAAGHGDGGAAVVSSDSPRLLHYSLSDDDSASDKQAGTAGDSYNLNDMQPDGIEFNLSDSQSSADRPLESARPTEKLGGNPSPKSSRRGELQAGSRVAPADHQQTDNISRQDPAGSAAMPGTIASESSKLEATAQTASFAVHASPRESLELTWEEHIRQAIQQLSAEESSSLEPALQAKQAAIARLLNLTLGELESAMEPIDGLQANEQDYFRYQFKALHDALDPQGNPVASRRWSLAMLSQRKAHQHLAAISNLEVNNAAFCTAVESFGVVSKFENTKFKADEELLLYCELDNFVSEAVKDGFETQLQGNYEIIDSSGRRIADQLLPMDSHICRNQLRDYFIAYRIYMPQKVAPGSYTLKLAIEDMKGRKFGQAELPFEIIR